MIVIRLNAGNDRNGNPRRVFVVFDSDGDIVDAIDEGYEGDDALRKLGYPTSYSTFKTTPAEYRDLLRIRGR